MSEKTEQATEHRLKEARKQGRIAQSGEVNTAAGFIAVVGYLLLAGGDMASELDSLFRLVLRHVEAPASARAASVTDMVLQISLVIARLCVPLLALPAVAAIAAGVAQTGGLVAFRSVMPDLQRVDPVKGAGNLFSVRNLLTLAKMLAGLLVITVVVGVMYRDMLPDMIRSGYVPAQRTVVLSWYFVSRLMMAGALVAALMAAADLLIQRFSFARQMRMSKEEVEDEHKNLEGDPMVKGRQRQFFEELLDDTEQEKIEQSEVVVCNPTHVAIAIRYRPGKIDLPLVALKGLDDKALAIRRHAELKGVPVYENRQLARDLYRDCPINQFITHQYFEAVAEVFKWLAKLRSAREMAQKMSARKERP